MCHLNLHWKSIAKYWSDPTFLVNFRLLFSCQLLVANILPTADHWLDADFGQLLTSWSVANLGQSYANIWLSTIDQLPSLDMHTDQNRPTTFGQLPTFFGRLLTYEQKPTYNWSVTSFLFLTFGGCWLLVCGWLLVGCQLWSRMCCLSKLGNEKLSLTLTAWGTYRLSQMTGIWTSPGFEPWPVANFLVICWFWLAAGFWTISAKFVWIVNYLKKNVFNFFRLKLQV